MVKPTFDHNLNEILVERNDSSEDVRNEDPQNIEAEKDNEDDGNPITNLVNKIIEEKATQEPTLTVLKRLSKSISYKAKGKA